MTKCDSEHFSSQHLGSYLEKKKKRKKENKEKEVRGQKREGRLQGMGRGGGSQRGSWSSLFLSQYIYVSLCFCVNVFFSQCMPIKHLEYAKHISAYFWVDIIYHLPSPSIYSKRHVIGWKRLKLYPSNSVIVIFPPYYL